MPPKAKKAKSCTMLLKRAKEISREGKKIRGGDLEPDAILQCTEKLNNCSLLLQQRCMECRGETVRDVVGKVMPDLRYDIKGGRFLPCTLATVAATRAPRSSRGWQTACRDQEPEGARGSARARAGAGRACRGRNAWGMP